MKEKVLNIFKRNGNKKLDPIEIVKYLSKDYDVKDIKEVMDILYELVSDGSIVSCKKGMFKLTGDEYVKGKVERVSSGNGYLLQSDGDIYIDKKNMNTALYYVSDHGESVKYLKGLVVLRLKLKKFLIEIYL
mgnify:CR=1 FL=1